MFNQLEEESVHKAREMMPVLHASLDERRRALRECSKPVGPGQEALRDGVAKLLERADTEYGAWKPADAEPSKRDLSVPKSKASAKCKAHAKAPHGVRDALTAQKRRHAKVLMRGLRDAIEQHARHRREVEQGGSMPSHFVTLTTAIYQWADLKRVLEDYEGFARQRRGGAHRIDPLEPGEDRVPAERRRVQMYTGVVAWF